MAQGSFILRLLQFTTRVFLSSFSSSFHHRSLRDLLAVFRGRVLGKLLVGQETRYDVQILHTYRNGFRLEHREFLWAPNTCDCPLLELGKQYIVMARRHVNHERTLNRILLEEDGYVVPYRPREEQLLRPLERLCSNRGAQEPRG